MESMDGGSEQHGIGLRLEWVVSHCRSLFRTISQFKKRTGLVACCEGRAINLVRVVMTRAAMVGRKRMTVLGLRWDIKKARDCGIAVRPFRPAFRCGRAEVLAPPRVASDPRPGPPPRRPPYNARPRYFSPKNLIAAAHLNQALSLPAKSPIAEQAFTYPPQT
jgi:hypothetical protein